jgi:hypothetical protein
MTLCAHVPKYTWHHDAVIPVVTSDAGVKLIAVRKPAGTTV